MQPLAADTLAPVIPVSLDQYHGNISYTPLSIPNHSRHSCHIAFRLSHLFQLDRIDYILYLAILICQTVAG